MSRFWVVIVYPIWAALIAFCLTRCDSAMQRENAQLRRMVDSLERREDYARSSAFNAGFFAAMRDTTLPYRSQIVYWHVEGDSIKAGVLEWKRPAR